MGNGATNIMRSASINSIHNRMDVTYVGNAREGSINCRMDSRDVIAGGLHLGPTDCPITPLSMGPGRAIRLQVFVIMLVMVARTSRWQQQLWQQKRNNKDADMYMFGMTIAKSRVMFEKWIFHLGYTKIAAGTAAARAKGHAELRSEQRQ